MPCLQRNGQTPNTPPLAMETASSHAPGMGAEGTGGHANWAQQAVARVLSSLASIAYPDTSADSAAESDAWEKLLREGATEEAWDVGKLHPPFQPPPPPKGPKREEALLDQVRSKRLFKTTV